jgi:hypothetical protein
VRELLFGGALGFSRLTDLMSRDRHQVWAITAASAQFDEFAAWVVVIHGVIL